ncbi:hypothetical protein CN096_32550 [Sinorhizobium meliloti]|nr:hypothetical protein CN096_32550 [Sinorhizobium meliloti]
MPELTRFEPHHGDTARPVITLLDAHPPRLYVDRATVSVPRHPEAPLRPYGRLVDEHCHAFVRCGRH